MNNCPALLLCDFYKTVHSEQYPKNMTKIVSYFTPRMSRVEDTHLVMFGLQAFIKQYLIEYFNENFFNKPKKEEYIDFEKMRLQKLQKQFNELYEKTAPTLDENVKDKAILRKAMIKQLLSDLNDTPIKNRSNY